MITYLRGNEHICLVDTEEIMGAGFLMIKSEDSLDLYQGDDWITIHKSCIPELIKILKNFNK